MSCMFCYPHIFSCYGLHVNHRIDTIRSWWYHGHLIFMHHMANKSKMMLEDDAWDLQATAEVHVDDLGWHEACECRLYPICCSQIWSEPTIHTQRAPQDLNTKFGKGTKSSPNLTNSAVEGTGSVAIYGFDCRVEPGSEYQAKTVLAVLFSLLYISVFVLFLLFIFASPVVTDMPRYFIFSVCPTSHVPPFLHPWWAQYLLQKRLFLLFTGTTQGQKGRLWQYFIFTDLGAHLETAHRFVFYHNHFYWSNINTLNMFDLTPFEYLQHTVYCVSLADIDIKCNLTAWQCNITTRWCFFPAFGVKFS